jgi:glyoxylase-like metal-dependent hydrolase (beta-lactamase superfamily II)
MPIEHARMTARRRFLAHAAMVAASSALPPAWLVAASAHPQLKVLPLTDRLSLISGGGGNVVLFNSPEGVLLVDGGAPEATTALLATIRKQTGVGRIHTLFNSHWHHDQTGANTVLGSRGTRIIAHENTRLWLGTDVDSKWESRQYPPLPVKARPNQTFYTAASLAFGGEQIDYGHLPQAHTDGDLYVWFRHANVLVGGGVLSSTTYPVIDYITGGWLGGMSTAVRTLAELGNATTKFVPATGNVMTLTEVHGEQQMLAETLLRLSKLLAQGMSVQDMIDAMPTRNFDPHWGDPTLFIANAWPGLVNRARELGVSIV